MDFEYQLKTLVRYVQAHIAPSAFAMYQPGFVTIGYFDASGGLHILADASHSENVSQTFDSLRTQINKSLSEINSGHEL